jgi:hypothetical protein
LDYLACLGREWLGPSEEVDGATLRPAFASLDLLVITVITPETERIMPGGGDARPSFANE